MENDRATRYMLQTHYAGFSEPCYEVINNPLNDTLKKIVSDWRRQIHASLSPDEVLPNLMRKDILECLEEIWQFAVEIVKNSFTGSGCSFECFLYYSGDTESESDKEPDSES